VLTCYDYRGILYIVRKYEMLKGEIKMTKRNMMKYAHKLAKMLVEKTGDYQIALSFALKEIWRQVKKYNKKRFTKYSIATAYDRIVHRDKFTAQADVFGVPAWIIDKNLSRDEAYAVLNETSSMEVVRETAKAKLVKFDTNYGNVTMWTPKSVLVA